MGKGDGGPRVRQLQEALVALGYRPGSPDGFFGDRTAAAVGGFQRDHGLAANGRADAATVEALNHALDDLRR